MKYTRPTAHEELQIQALFSDYYDELEGQAIMTDVAQAHQETLYYYTKDNVAVMDNHRGALWFWAQKIKADRKYDLYHLDTHLDLEKSNYLHDITSSQISDLSLRDFLEYKHTVTDDRFTFRWANYMPFFTEQFSDSIGNLYVSVNEEESPLGINFLNYSCLIYSSKGYDTVKVLEDLLDKDENPWIINIDIDFFFKYDQYLYSDSYIDRVLELLKNYIQRPETITTIALSPSCCGGWQNSIDLLQRMKSSGCIGNS